MRVFVSKSLVEENPTDLVREHKRLVAVLRSPSHADDLEEADKQAEELDEYEDDLTKAHIKGYTRKDGTQVKEHDDSRQDARLSTPTGKKGSTQRTAQYDHPYVVGMAKLGSQSPGDAVSLTFAGKEYHSTGKRGKSFHDGTPVREFESDDSHVVWLDGKGRIHADGASEVAGLRKRYEAARGAARGEVDLNKQAQSELDARGHKPKPAAGAAQNSNGKAGKTKSGWDALKDHPMFSDSDLAYFKSKGYEPEDVKAIWDRDHAAGHSPVQHKKAPDVVGVAANPDLYKAIEGRTVLLFSNEPGLFIKKKN